MDTAALLHWPVARLNGGVCAVSQLEELQRLSEARLMLVETADIQWRSPSHEALEQASASSTCACAIHAVINKKKRQITIYIDIYVYICMNMYICIHM